MTENEEQKAQTSEVAKAEPAAEMEFKGTRIHVKNLADSAKSEDVRKLFAEFGEVTEAVAQLNEDGTCKGYGYAYLKTKESADKAVEALNGKKVAEKELQVFLPSSGTKGKGKAGAKGGKGDAKGEGKGKGKGKSKGKGQAGTSWEGQGYTAQPTGAELGYPYNPYGMIPYYGYGYDMYSPYMYGMQGFDYSAMTGYPLPGLAATSAAGKGATEAALATLQAASIIAMQAQAAAFAAAAAVASPAPPTEADWPPKPKGKGKGKDKGKDKGKGKGKERNKSKAYAEGETEVIPEAPAPDKVFTGTLKSRSEKNGYGFIDCKEIKETYKRDLWVDAEALPEQAELNSKLEFNVILSAKGRPQAKNVKLA